MRKMMLAGATALAMVSTAALASVTFDPATGTGFVGKGDVQMPFGWNNADAQTNIPATTFVYNDQTDYSFVCVWTTGEGKKGQQTHHVTHERTVTVNSTVWFEERSNKKGQITGINLNGFNDTTESGGDVPVVGGPCPGNPGTGAVIESVTNEGTSGGALSAVWNGTSFVIWP